MKNSRMIFLVSILGLLFFSLVVFIVSKFMVFNLQASQKYEALDFSTDIQKSESMGQISLVFFLILSVLFVGYLVFSSIKK